MTRYEAFIEAEWRTAGMAQVVVARIRAGDRVEIGFFLVDSWCLGVKDAFLVEESSESELREIVDQKIPEFARERLHPACAKKIIEGVVAYAESLGFAPHRDFRKARRVLTGVDSSDCPESFVFGCDGKPCYIEGPHDPPERVERVLAMLEARCGADGFNYVLVADVADEDDDVNEAEGADDADDARDALIMFFEDEPETAPTFFEFCGMVTALQICPQVVSPARMVEKLWPPPGRVWEDEDELRDFIDDVRVYWNLLADLVATCGAAEENDPDAYPIDIFEEDFDHPEEMAGAVVWWARGFMRATQEWPEAWGDALKRPDLAPHWQLVQAWSSPEKPESVDLLMAKGANDPPAKLTKNLPLAVNALSRALRRPSDENA